MTGFASKWMTWEPPETSRVRTDKTDKRASVSFVSAYSTYSQGNVAARGEAANEGPAGSIVQHADSAVSGNSPFPKSNRTTPETQRVGTAKTDKRWDPETAVLISWFLGSKPPARPFELQQAVCIAHPSRYWEYLKGDINAGPRRARGKTGALQDDLRRLHKLFGGD